MPPFANPVPYATQNFMRPHGGVQAGMVFPQTGVPALLRDPRDGTLYTNQKKASEKWNWLTAPGSGTALNATIAANGQLQIGMSPGLEEGSLGDAELVKMIGQSTGRFATRIYDPFLDRWYSNQPVASDLMWGAAAELPAVLYESIFSPASTTLGLQISDLSGLSNTLQLDFAGRRFLGCGPRSHIWDAFRSRKTHPYWLTLDQGSQVTVAAATTQRFTMTVPAECDFEAWTFMDDTTNNATGAVAEYEIRLFEGASGRSLIGAPASVSVPISLIAAKSRTVAGVAGGRLRAVGNPFVMTFSHLFQRKTQVQIDVVNTNAFAIDVRLAFHGRVLYTPGCPPDDTLRMLEPVVGQMQVPQVLGTQGQPAPQNGYGTPAAQQGSPYGALWETQGRPQAGYGYGAGQGRT